MPETRQWRSGLRGGEKKTKKKKKKSLRERERERVNHTNLDTKTKVVRKMLSLERLSDTISVLVHTSSFT